MRWSSRILAGAALAAIAAGCASERTSLTAPETPTRHGSSRQVGIGADATGLSTQDLTQGVTATQLAQTIAGAGITVSNVVYSGADTAAGTFSGGTDIVGFESGIILSSGVIRNVIGPNTTGSVTAANGTPGDAELDKLTGPDNLTEDAAILTFDFVPDGDSVKFQYVFASDEYNEFVNTAFNDVFAFYVNGENCALVGDPAVPVTINTINNGNPFGTPPVSHPELYRNNEQDSNGSSPINTEMDGLTKVLTCSAAVNAGVTNTMRLAIADASDDAYDSNVFLSAKSLTVKNDPPTAAINVPSDGDFFIEGATVPFTGSGTDAEDGALTGSSLVWTSNKDGQIGTGSSFSTSGLSVGTHTITLTATDSKGATGSASIQLTIESGQTGENEAPTVNITAPVDGFELLQGSSLAFAGTGTDAEDGALTGSSLVWTSDKDGQIGTGTSFSTTSLSLGVHTITLTGTDSKGAKGTASVMVNVGYSKVMGPDGGDVCAVGCQVLIFVPKGALTAQTTITVFFAPDAPTASGMIPGSARTLGPSDLTFVTPADMGMIYDPSTLPAGVAESQLRLFRYDGTSWQPVSGSVVNTSTNVVSGFISAGGTYAIFAVDD